MVECNFCHSKEAIAVFEIVITLEELLEDYSFEPSKYRKYLCGRCCNHLADILEMDRIMYKKLYSKRKLHKLYVKKRKKMDMTT